MNEIDLIQHDYYLTSPANYLLVNLVQITVSGRCSYCPVQLRLRVDADKGGGITNHPDAENTIWGLVFNRELDKPRE